MQTASAPPPYTSTTSTHLLRFVAIWVTAMGLLLLVLSSGQLFVWDDPGALLLAMAMTGGGAAVWLGCRWWLESLHRSNREFLLSEDGVSALAGRAAFARRVRTWSVVALVGFMVAGAVVIFAGSAMGCVGARDGACRLPEIDSSVFSASRSLAVGAGAAYVGLMILGRSHRLESDRIEMVIAEGQRRRMEGPIPGVSRSRWE
ncbi:hypothetical protein [Demequina activiva]|uniref:Uncharacterized protein n=1 Tax=Demequina activiva TaxID=1582364 RepID=A0A919Q1G1_9MICO|nr:hypothetical protein [Demequina activiva]GIG54151.1 hypothetical protein Dac01nite_09030 [Demequina activiva]